MPLYLQCDRYLHSCFFATSCVHAAGGIADGGYAASCIACHESVSVGRGFPLTAGWCRLILFDGIIFSLQSGGGVSVLFSEMLQRLDKQHRNFTLLRYDQSECLLRHGRTLRRAPRFMERYRRCDTSTLWPRLFHSTYYRLPTQAEYIVTTVHDFTYERFVNGPRRIVHSSQKKAAIRRADKIICVSYSTCLDLLEASFLVLLRELHMVGRCWLVHSSVISGSALKTFFPVKYF